MRLKAVSGIVLTVLLIGTLTLAFNTAHAQPPETEWTRTYGGASADRAWSVVETSDGGYAIGGCCFANLVKTDADGNQQWNKSYGGVVYCVVETVDGGYALAGEGGNNDFWLVKTYANGTMQWNQTYGGANMDEATSVVATSDGGYALAGYTYSFGAGSEDFWLVKVDSVGNHEWNQTYGGDNDDLAISVVATEDGGYALAGYTGSFGASGWNAWLVKVDSSGNHEWNKTYGGASSAYSVVATSDGGYALAGMTLSFGAGYEDFWLVKVDEDGNHQWNKTYGGTEDDWAYSVVKTIDGGYALTGFTNSFGAGDRDFWLVKVNSSGDHEWNQTYGGDKWDEATSVVATSDGGYALAGWTESFGVDGWDFWLVKVAGPPTPVGGIWASVDKLALLAPYIGLAITIILATVAASVFVKHKKKKKQ